MAAQVFLGQFPALIRIAVVFLWVEIDAVAQLLHQFVRLLPGQKGHIGQIHTQFAVQADLQGVLGGISVVDLPERPDGWLVEDGRFIPAALILALILDGAEQGELVVIGKGEDIALAVDGPILGGKAVIDLIEFILRFAEVQRVILMGLDADDLQKRGTNFTQTLDAGRFHAGVGLWDQLVFLAVIDFAVLHHKGEISGPFGGVLIIGRLFFLRFLQRLHIRLRAETGV